MDIRLNRHQYITPHFGEVRIKLFNIKPKKKTAKTGKPAEEKLTWNDKNLEKNFFLLSTGVYGDQKTRRGKQKEQAKRKPTSKS
jgi:hypothetical protein